MPMKTKKNPARTHKSDVLDDFFSVKDKKEYNKTEKNMLLAIRIESAMKKCGYNKLQFAQAMEVQPSMVTRWLSGTHNFTIETLYDIENLLSICVINPIEPTLIEVIDHLHVTVSTTKLPAGNPAGNLNYNISNLTHLQTHKPQLLKVIPN